MSGKIFFNSHKFLVSLLAGLLGLFGGVAATSYALGVDRANVEARLDGHDKELDRIFNLTNSALVITQGDIRSINEAITKIQIDIAVLKSNSSHK